MAALGIVRVLASATAIGGLATGAAAAGALTFSTASAPAEGPTGFTMASRVFLPYNGNDGYAFGMGANEKSAFDGVEKYYYAISEQGYVNVVDWSDAANPEVKPALAIDLAGLKLTDISVCPSSGMLFVAHGAADTVSNGMVKMYSTVKRDAPAAPAFQKEVTTGPLPDMISPNPDCTKLAVANEGEGVYDDVAGLIDPAGSMSIVTDLSADTPTVTTVSFSGLGTDTELINMGVHLPLSLDAMEYWDDHSALNTSLDFTTARATYSPAMNLEPEYLAWSAAGDKVFVNLQENSALVTVDVPSSGAPSAARIDAYGLKDWSADGSTNGIDLIKDDACVLKKFPGYKTLRNPDTIALVNVDGVDYVLTANEGDDKAYGDWEEKLKAADVVSSSGDIELEDFIGFTITASAKADYLAQNAMDADSKRRITIGSASVDYSNPRQPRIIDMVGFGGRGISIWQPKSTGLDLIWDSGSDLEEQQCARYPWAHNGIQDEEFSPVNGVLYNSSGEGMRETLDAMSDPDEDGCSDQGDGTPGACPLGQTVDDQSPKDGAAPEAVVVGVACGRLVAVTATEKQDTAFVYDITNIASPTLLFVQHLSPASETLSPGLAYAARSLGEIDPEGQIFIDAEHSPSGKAAVIFGGAWSGTASMWEFECPESTTTSVNATTSTTQETTSVDTTTSTTQETAASEATQRATPGGTFTAAAAGAAALLLTAAAF